MPESPHLLAVLKKPQVFLPILSVILVLAAFIILLSINKPSEITDGRAGLKYENSGLGFSLLLPESFEYFQTQRKEEGNYVDIEIFIPTTDRTYAQEVPGYAKAIVVRSYEREYWDSLAEKDEPRKDFIYQGIADDRAIAIKFWSNIPVDWESKWSKDTSDFILKGFKLD